MICLQILLSYSYLYYHLLQEKLLFNVVPAQVDQNVVPAQVDQNVVPAQVDQNVVPAQVDQNVVPVDQMRYPFLSCAPKTCAGTGIYYN